MPDGSRSAAPPAAPVAPYPVADLFTVANLITFSRLCAVPFVVWLVLHGRAGAAFWTFAAAGATDLADGWAARRWGTSRFGALLDPMADKVMIVAVGVTLAVVRALPDWLVILLVFRDVLIVGGILALAVMGQRVAIRPLAFSKVNTALQIVLVATALALPAFARPAPLLLAVLVWLTAATTVASGAMYVWLGGRGSWRGGGAR